MVKILLILLAVIMICYIYFEVNYPVVNYVKVKSTKLIPGDGIRVLQISDYHNFKPSNRVLDVIKVLNSDIIVITGDLIDERTKCFDNVFNFVQKIVSINTNTYFVNGNHEWKNGNIGELLSGIAERRVTVLNNTNKIVNIRGAKINICGIDDVHTKHDDIAKAIQGIDKDLLTILLSHSPNIVIKQKDIAADIVLCGHTHGGQIRLPFIGALIAPGQGLFPKYNKGLYTINDNTVLHIDSGLGSSKTPLRFLNRSQISIVSIERHGV